MYTAELINKKPVYFEGDDVVLKFIVRDDEGTMITNFDNLAIKCEVTDYGNETKLQDENAGGGDDEISVSSGEISVYVPNADTVDYMRGYFIVELQLEDVSQSDDIKIYTVFHGKIYFAKETLDW